MARPTVLSATATLNAFSLVRWLWPALATCSGPPICCSVVPVDIDLDQPTAQLCVITVATAMAPEPPLSWLVRAIAVLRQLLPAQARLQFSLSVNPDLMIVQDAFRARLALLQRVVPFDVARVRQLLTGTIR